MDKHEKDLLHFNGIGGFSQNGTEYILYLNKEQDTPAPWINVIANSTFGFITSEAGAGYVWHNNAHEYRLTPWSNDTIEDRSSEIIYIKDDESGQLWNPTRSPIRNEGEYVIRHGFGYSVFETVQNQIRSELTQFVPRTDSVKLSLLVLENLTDSKRSLSVTYYMKPVLGESPELTSSHIVTQSTKSGLLTMTNPFSEDYYNYTAYLDCSITKRSLTADRTSFFGSGTLSNPDALSQLSLNGLTGSGFDSCGAIQVQISLDPHEKFEVVFQLGSSQDVKYIEEMANRYKTIEQVNNELNDVKDFWKQELTVVQVETPDDTFDLLMNGWLQYQIISSRIWGRTGFYQSGGAFGFRDQLQDVLSLTITNSDMVRKQILHHAAHQFIEGDVQHWWHPPFSKGVRTRITDDRLWLVYVLSEYINKTQDYEILRERVPFLESEVLLEQESERYEKPSVTSELYSLYEHCIRAIDVSMTFGIHGLPLIGTGDWNDGMNQVGVKGKGESVWLGWFFLSILQKMVVLSQHENDGKYIEKYSETIVNLQASLELHSWDGQWYRRAFYDDGTILGSSSGEECKIDSISQSWSVLSGFADTKRKKQAMQSLEDHLIDRGNGIIKLLTPPFDKGLLNPGYIKDYVPGVRENGGQYTHAAAWVIIAFAQLNEKEKATELFNMINPINHTRNYRDYLRYKNEPYVMSGDVYSVHPHTGSAGWSWDTGAASWMYQAGLEYILGFKKKGNILSFNPVISNQWRDYTIDYRYNTAKYIIHVTNEFNEYEKSQILILDGKVQENKVIILKDDSRSHYIEVKLRYSE